MHPLRTSAGKKNLSHGKHAVEGTGAGGAVRLYTALLRGGTGCGHRSGFRRSAPSAGVLSRPWTPCQHPDDSLQQLRRGASAQYGSQPHCSRKGAQSQRIAGNPTKDRSGAGDLYPRRHVLLLFRPVSVQQHPGRAKRKQRKVRPALQASLLRRDRQKTGQGRILSEPEGPMYHRPHSGTYGGRHRFLQD